MNKPTYLLAAAFLLCALCAQAQERTDDEELRITAVEALISAPPSRALPIVMRVLRGDDSNEVKEAALFIVAQHRSAEARALLLEVARDGEGDLQQEAVRMIAINGDPELMAELGTLYRNGDEGMREAVLEAYLIAGDSDAVLAIAEAATSADEFEAAVEMLGAMGATDKLRALRGREDMYKALIDAYAIAGDIESLRKYALDGSNVERQAEALEGLAIAGDDEAQATFVQIYRSSDNPKLKEAALDAMMISGNDETVLQLFRESTDPDDKKALLETLVHMGSESVWDIIDSTLEDD